VYPSGAIYAGDRISLAAAVKADPGGGKLQARLDSQTGEPLGESDFSFNSDSGKWEARLAWVWDASGKEGWHTLYVSLSGGKEEAGSAPFRYPVRILPADKRPAARRESAWQHSDGVCCDYYYLSGTEAERDINEVTALAEEIYVSIQSKMETVETAQAAPANDGSETKRTLVFLPRILGQGGLVIQEGYLTYADRNYTSTDFSVLLEHELNHLVTIARYESSPRAPLLLQEGWAVYLTGGHYQRGESLALRAAALLALGQYTPLSELADSFHAAQHEAAYIEAGAFVEYLAGRYGRAETQAMLFDPAQGKSPAGELDAMLQEHFGCTLSACEAAWLAGLRAAAADPETVRDVEFTMALFDRVREYQQAYTPGDSMADLFLPDPERARAERITADFLSPPMRVEPITIELIFLAARAAADRGEWAAARAMLDAAGTVLAAKTRRAPDPIRASATAARFRALVEAILRNGREPLQIDLTGDTALVVARNPDTLAKEDQRWNFNHGSWARNG
jgi:hypothetical protein